MVYIPRHLRCSECEGLRSLQTVVLSRDGAALHLISYCPTCVFHLDAFKDVELNDLPEKEFADYCADQNVHVCKTLKIERIVHRKYREATHFLRTLALQKAIRTLNFQRAKSRGYHRHDYRHGRRYEGDWQNGLPHGTGTLNSEDGTIYQGSWRNGRPDGVGFRRNAEGHRIQGSWKEGLLSGPCRFFWQDGSTFTGRFIAGILIDAGDLKSSHPHYEEITSMMEDKNSFAVTIQKVVRGHQTRSLATRLMETTTFSPCSLINLAATACLDKLKGFDLPDAARFIQAMRPRYLRNHIVDALVRDNRLKQSPIEIYTDQGIPIVRRKTERARHDDVARLGLLALAKNDIRGLDLREASFGEPQVHVLALPLAHLRFLSRIDLSWNPIGITGMEVVAAVLSGLPFLTHVKLCGVQMKTAGALHAGSLILRSQSIRVLDMSFNDIGVGGAVAIAEPLTHNGSLRELNLRSNALGPLGVKVVLEAIAKRQSGEMEKLTLADNNTGNHVAAQVASHTKLNLRELMGCFGFRTEQSI